ncbi:uncharacterized protein [Dendrobates tinctorius]|uniref:uncharacterized protein n=1 Tax=Dendrobates tinctorius TaxID=92724 RepID=UPI003CCA4233
MDEDRDETTRRLFHCALEIISLLSGEDYTIVRKTPGDCVTPIIHLQESGGRSPGPITEPPPHSPIHERNKKILELSNKMIELLSGEVTAGTLYSTGGFWVMSGEVPIRCQDVAVYLSMEEWEYLEGHQDRYQAVMMEELRPLTPRDGSRRRNPPERCPRPLCPQDCPEENHNISEDHQGEDLIDIKVEVIHGAEEATAIWADQQDGSRRRNPPERCPRPLCPQDCPEENHNISEDHQGEDLIDIKVEVIHGAQEAITIWADQQDGSRRRNPPERCPHPLCPQDCPEENHNISEDHQGEDLTNIKAEFEKEEIDVITENLNQNSEENFMLLNDDYVEDEDIRLQSSEENPITLEINKGLHSTVQIGHKPYSCSACGKCFRDKSSFAIHQRIHTGEKPYSCSECGKCFTHKSTFVIHRRIHTGEKPYPCSECGKCFITKTKLGYHHRSHTGEKPYLCSLCGKCFFTKPNLHKHQGIHERIQTEEKPFSCSECGKCFTHKSTFVIHQRIHTGEKPYSCSECGKCFITKTKLSDHHRSHTGERPYSCSQCGKCFLSQPNLLTHKKIHTREKSHACSECGKIFAYRSSLVKHLRTHTKPYSCIGCGKRFSDKSSLVRHERSKKEETPYSCSECGKCFAHQPSLVKHWKCHTSV